MSPDYDVIVVGAGMGGLSAAIHSAVLGKRVLVLEQQPEVGGKACQVKQDGYMFDPGPSIVIMPWIYEQVFKHAGEDMRDHLVFERLDPFFSIRAEGGEMIEFPADEKAFFSFIENHFPRDIEAFRRILKLGDDIYPTVKETFFAQVYQSVSDLIDPSFLPLLGHTELLQPFKKPVDAWFSDPLLRAFFYSFPTYSGQTYFSRSPGSFLIPYIMIREGVYYPTGGIGAIPRAFVKLAEKKGVEVRTKTKVSAFLTEGNRVTGVKTGEGETVSAQTVISNIDKAATLKMLGRPYPRSTSFSYVSVQMGVRKELPGLHLHQSCIPHEYERPYRDLYEKRIYPRHHVLYLNVPSAVDPSFAPAGCANVFAVIPTPAQDPSLDWAVFEKTVVSDVCSELSRYDIHIRQEEIDTVRIQTPRYFEEAHGNYGGSLFGPDEKERPVWGMLPLANTDEMYDNLYYCGGSVQPGAGLPMATLSGKFIGDIIIKIT
jgi:phytoene desaturase